MTFFNIHFPCVLRPIFRVFVCARCFECLFAPDVSSVCLRPIFRAICVRYFARFAPDISRDLRPIFRAICTRYFARFTPDISRDLRPCVSGGVAPIPTFCPYRARYLLNPVHGGNPGCRSLRSLYPGLRYHCLRRSQAAPQHSS